MRLEGKRAVITGAASGIGRATAERFVREGARVAALDIDSGGLADLAQALGPAVLPLTADAAARNEVEAAAQRTAGAFGEIDILFNNAGIARRNRASEHSEDDWDTLMRVNLRSVFLCSKYFLPHLRKPGGAIINTSSVVGLVGVRNRAGYSTSKGAIVTLTKSMALDYAGEGVRVNCVCPGFVETAMTAPLFAQPEALARVTAMHPLGRLATAGDIANAVVFLASDEAAFITGQALAVDGGFTVGRPEDI